MRIVIFLLFALFVFHPDATVAQNVKEMQAQLQKEVSKLKEQITDLDKKILTAKKENPDLVENLLKEKEQLELSLNLMEEGLKSMTESSDDVVQQAMDDKGDNEIPKRDDKRIAMIPDRILSDGELVLFIQKVNADIGKRISAESKTMGIQLCGELKKENVSAAKTGQYAVSCWMNGFPEMALYVAGKSCLDDMTNPDNLNNYASFLSMAGVEESALPILQNLNLKTPYNSTLLNNIGQAWFGLGEIGKAKQYLDSAVMIYAHHSKANFTKSVIAKSEGNTQEAAEAMQNSIEEAYSSEKEARLEKSGGKLHCDNLTIPYQKLDEENLFGWKKFNIPEYPASLEESKALDDQWNYFKDQLGEATDKLDLEIERLKNKEKDYETTLAAQPNQANMLCPYFCSGLYKIAYRKYLCFLESGWIEDQINMRDEKRKEANLQLEALKKQHEINIEALSKIQAECNKYDEENLKYMIAQNMVLHNMQSQVLNLEKKIIAEQIYYEMFTTSPLQFELVKEKHKRYFLTVLQNFQHASAYPTCGTEMKELGPHDSIPDFDDIHCEYVTVINIPGSKFTIECNKLTSEFDLIVVKGHQEENLNTGKTKGEIEFGLFRSLGGAHMGPVSAEIKAEAGVFIDYGNGHIADVGVTAGVKAEAGITTPHQMEEMVQTHHNSKIAFGDFPSQTIAGVSLRAGINSDPNIGATLLGVNSQSGGGHH